jgi:type II secretory pathway component PulJ
MTARFHRTRRRRGITIIETIVLMTAVAAMLGLCVVMLQLLMRLSADSRTRLDGATSLDRLARQFRRDVHEAGAARQLERPAAKLLGLRLEPGPRHTVEYQLMENGKIARVETRNENLVRREIYDIPRSGGGRARLVLTERDGKRFAGLRVDRQASRNPSDPERPYEILALVGKNASQLSAPAQQKGAKP